MLIKHLADSKNSFDVSSQFNVFMLLLILTSGTFRIDKRKEVSRKMFFYQAVISSFRKYLVSTDYVAGILQTLGT